MLHEKHFTLAEAQELIPDLKNRLSEMIDLKKSLDSKGYDISRHHFFGGIGPNGDGKYPSELEALIRVIADILGQGILIKDMDSGLVDFPHIRNGGEEVYLCFLFGEDKIRYWHGIRNGFAGRRPVGEL